MSIVSRNGGADASGTTSITPGYPANISTGQFLLLAVVNKYPANGPATPAGWTFLAAAQASGGSGAAGVDTGNVFITVFYKVSDGTETGTETVTIASGNSSYGKIFRYSGAANGDPIPVQVTAVNGTDNTAGTAWSIVTGAVEIHAGDMVIACSGINTDAYTYSAEAFSQTGTTFGTVNEFWDSNTLQGDDCGLVVADVLVSSGSGTGALTYTMTASGTATNRPAGATVVFVLREVFTATISSPVNKTVAALTLVNTSDVPNPIEGFEGGKGKTVGRRGVHVRRHVPRDKPPDLEQIMQGR